MTDELKKEYARRITNSNKTQLICILYELVILYTDEAKKYVKNDIKKTSQEIQKARGCVKELMNSLDFNYPLASNLLSIYVYTLKELVNGQVHKSEESLELVIYMMSELYEAYCQVEESDDSEAIMSNTQTLYAGLTYGKGNLVENLGNQSHNRGFLA